jgi:pyruvate dehydrogenase E1 component alpha subunit
MYFDNLMPYGFKELAENILKLNAQQNKMILPNLSLSQAIILYYSMYLIRKTEETIGAAYGRREIGGFCHLYIGQEAIAVGIKSCLNKGDKTITAYRCHGHMLMSGASPTSIIAELMGKAMGCSHGKGGSMHLFNIEEGFFGGHGIVGAQVPIGTGLAFASKYKKDNSVCMVYMGDGAANQGQVYEAINMAKLWSLPVVYVIENNGYGMGTSCERACAGELYKRGDGYGIDGVRINGMDLIEVRNSFDAIIEQVRTTSQPALVEVMCYRYKGHSMSDPALYRTKEEVNTAKNDDPVVNFKNMIIEHGVMSSDVDVLEDYIKNIVKVAYKESSDAPMPEESELYTDICPAVSL